MRRARTLATLLAACSAAALALAPNADAHVTVTAPGATRGGSDQEITFRVPVEKDVATVGLTIALPTRTPIASVLVAPVTGWTHSQHTVRLAKPIVTDDGSITTAVSQITWTAQPGHGLRPGEFGAFTIIAGQLPDTASLTFPALQHYADGSTVRWNEVAAPGSKDEPDNPAPVLTLTAKHTHAAAHPHAAPSSDDTLPTVLSAVALALAVLALIGVLAVARRGRRGGVDGQLDRRFDS